MARNKKKQKRKGLFLPLLLVAAVVVGGSVLMRDYSGSGSSLSAENSREVVVEAGASTAQIAEELKNKGVIRYPFFFRVVSRLGRHDSHYKQGTFLLSESAGYPTIFRSLSNPANGQVNTVRVTIPEGFEFRQIADRLAESGLVNREAFCATAENASFEYDFLQNLPKRENRLEGYLFPDTYLFVKGTDTEKTILDAMLARFEEMVYTPNNRARAKELGMSMDEVVTLASVVEREAMGDADRKNVSSVFHNRLKSKEYPCLQSCATVQYILKERKKVLSVADTKIDSPYNTYRNPGLPVGPIASPGAASVEAALYPNKTEYLFFVLGSDGVHHFSKTYEEHLANEKK